jgi:hypothetical protein
MGLVFDTCSPLDGDGDGSRTVLEFPLVDVGGANVDDVFAVALSTLNIPRGIMKISPFHSYWTARQDQRLTGTSDNESFEEIGL